ncbi:MAG: hypothetical protein JNL88_00540 [Bacteroidia bacterium]|nr:hypothetical protein [Bacteroidia bacterium]
MIHKIKIALLVFVSIFSTFGCGQKGAEEKRPEPIEIPEKELKIKIIRFEEEIFTRGKAIDTSGIRQLREKYGDFFELWCVQLAGIVPPGKRKPSDVEIAYNMNQYLNDRYIRQVFYDSEKKFKDLRWLEQELEPVFLRYQAAFPGKPLPQLLSYLSPFSSNIMTMDSMLGIGLHFYLGKDYQFYPSLQLPGYMIRKMEKEYILNDLLRGWLDSEYFNDSAQKNCLAQMIYQGKVLYAMDVLSPDTPDSIKTGYSAAQLKWAYGHEEQLWSFFIEQQLLYNSNPKVYLKYIHDGNSTSGFPKEAPARLGAFIGWQIVRSYMRKHEPLTLKALFELNDAQAILAASGYKPPKQAL